MVNKKAMSFALFLMLISIWLTVSIIVNTAGGGSISIAGFGGYFLYNTFYHLAFYVPLYLLLCSFFLLRKNFNKNDIVVLILTLVPFFTAGLALRIYLKAGSTVLERLILGSFGPLSPLLLLLLIIIEILLIIHTSIILNKHPDLLDGPYRSPENDIPDSRSDETISSNTVDADVPEIPDGVFKAPSVASEVAEEENREEHDDFDYNVFQDDISENKDHDVIHDDQASENSEEENNYPEKEEYKALSLSSISSLTGRKSRNNESGSGSYSEDNRIEDKTSEYDGTESPESYGITYPEMPFDRGKPDSEKNAGITGSGITENDYADAEIISEEFASDGINYSEPAFYRQQKDSAPYQGNGESEPVRNNPALENAGIDYADQDYKGGSDADKQAAVISSDETDYNESALLSDFEDDDIYVMPLDKKGDNSNASGLSGAGENDVFPDKYDPVTQYNDQIKTDEGPEISLYPDVPVSDYEEEEDDDPEPALPDNTAIVKQYFESARFIKPPKKPGKYVIPVEDVLDFYQEESYDTIDVRAKEEADILKRTLAEFKIEAEVTGIRKGPVITMFEILPAPGVKLSRITNLADNIALRLAASRVRIVAPIPGKHAVGIEVPNRKRAIVSFREIIEVDYNQYKKDTLPIVLGKDITGGEQIVDLTKTPHLLIAGATGSGKSVCVNSIITSILYTRPPRDVKMILIDPKIVELKLYNGIPHLLTPVVTDSKKAFQALQYCVFEMERRYTLLDALSCRDIKSFNRKIKNEKIATMPLPYIVVVVDEFADLMATTGKELESTLARLAAMSRAVGIHLVLATQRPSIDVITGLIKANIPSRIAFMVASKTDSRIIIDSSGAEMLLGKGDMLFTSAWDPYPVRIQGAFLSEGEVEKVVEQVKEYGEPEYIDDEIFIDDDDDDYISFEEENINDPLMERALEIVTTAGKASASYLQRRLKIGYNRAARLVEEMERKGIVGPQNGSKPRDLLHIPDNFKE